MLLAWRMSMTSDQSAHAPAKQHPPDAGVAACPAIDTETNPCTINPSRPGSAAQTLSSPG
jgi:hypothetical protein